VSLHVRKQRPDFVWAHTHEEIGILEAGRWSANGWNLMGLVDYLQTRPIWIPGQKEIGAIGWSLGTTTLTYWVPFDERIRPRPDSCVSHHERLMTTRTGKLWTGRRVISGRPYLFNFVPASFVCRP